MTRHGQTVRCRSVARAVACLLWLVLAGSCGVGCSSIYHRTRTQLPPEPIAELSLRVAEAREVDRRLEQSGRQLLERLRQRSPSIEFSFDRLEAETHELERCLRAAAAAARRCEPTPEIEAEMESLRARARVWGAYVEANRGADPATQEWQLEALLQSGSRRTSVP